MMRPADLTLARLHLRLGSLALARAELETLAGRDELDDAGMVDLAEARWRTGDIAGAGEVASTVLGDGDDGPLITLVVAAEAALARGRPTEARRFSTKAMEAADGRIDEVFAGMPRGPVWPTDAAMLHLPPPTLFDVPAVVRADTGGDEGSPAIGIATSETAAPADPDTIALWEPAIDSPAIDHRTPDAPIDIAPAPPEPAPDLDAGGDAFLAGADALDRGDITVASMQLALALRLSPSLASDVLEVIDGRADRELAFVRGDAYRLVGRESDARRAFADAVRPGDAIDPPPHHDSNHHDPHDHDPYDHAPEGDPA